MPRGHSLQGLKPSKENCPGEHCPKNGINLWFTHKYSLPLMSLPVAFALWDSYGFFFFLPFYAKKKTLEVAIMRRWDTTTGCKCYQVTTLPNVTSCQAPEM